MTGFGGKRTLGPVYFAFGIIIDIDDSPKI